MTCLCGQIWSHTSISERDHHYLPSGGNLTIADDLSLFTIVLW